MLCVCAGPLRGPCRVTLVRSTDKAALTPEAALGPGLTVTGIVKASAAPGAATEMNPVWIPAGRLAGFTATETVFDPDVEPDVEPCVEPSCGPTASQEPESDEAV